MELISNDLKSLGYSAFIYRPEIRMCHRWACWLTPVVPVLARRTVCKSKASLGYRVRSHLKKVSKQTERKTG